MTLEELEDRIAELEWRVEELEAQRNALLAEVEDSRYAADPHFYPVRCWQDDGSPILVPADEPEEDRRESYFAGCRSVLFEVVSYPDDLELVR